MNDDVLHVPTGRLFNLQAADSGGDGRDIIDAIYQKIQRGELLCGEHGSPLYLSKRRGHFWGIHFDGTDCRKPSPGMSDEHKRQTEYLIRAAEHAGYTTAREVALPGVRPDAVFTGPVAAIAIEVQRSSLTASAAVARTRKTIAAGLSTSAWFNDRPQDRQPPWAFKVPTIGMNVMRWETLPPRRAVAVTTGVRMIRAKRCDGGRCLWGKGRRACGGFHPEHVSHLTEVATNRSSSRELPTEDRALTADDVATMLPAGLLVPIRFRGRDVLLVPPESVRLYEELTGRPAELVFNPFASSVIGRVSADPELRPCGADRPILWPDVWPERWEQRSLLDGRRDTCYGPFCTAPTRLYPSGRWCDNHAPRRTNGDASAVESLERGKVTHAAAVDPA